ESTRDNARGGGRKRLDPRAPSRALADDDIGEPVAVDVAGGNENTTPERWCERRIAREGSVCLRLEELHERCTSRTGGRDDQGALPGREIAGTDTPTATE